jgi:hypothetical protein
LLRETLIPRRRRLPAVLAAAALLAAVASATASATTAPGYRFQLQVEMTDSQLRLVPQRTASGKLLHNYIRAGGRVAQFPRGTLIEFVFSNHGSKIYLPAIRVRDASRANPLAPTKPLYTARRAIRPGQKVSMFGNFYFRGTFQIEKLLGKKPQGVPIELTIY